MLRVNGIMPVLRVADMQKALDWYTDRLGFELCWRKPGDGGGENSMLRAGAATMMLSTGQHLGDKPGLTGTLYFNVDDVAELYESVKNDVDLVWPLETMDYGSAEFGVRDCDGYVLAFAQQKH
jgi:uncharacterized glyoxalase superfamily protein PhnB